ncbi:MFS transporter, partial [Amylibacter sp.]|nr:MFS transporter [Amylibacter sp.]
EGMSPQTMSWVMTGYFVGFLFGSQLTPNMIRRVGHVRVFAALGSLVSACLILYAAWTNPYFWFLLRIIVGFCFSGIYVVAESWLNDSSSNETRGQTLSAYLIVQMMGIVLAQAVLNFADPSGYMLFIIISVVVSLSFAPILLSVSPAPQFQTSKRMTLSQLWSISPLGVVGQFFLGAIFAALFGMASVYGTERGLTVKDISLFVAAIYFGGMILQYPIGWVSDRMDRRVLIFIVCSIGTFFSFAANLSDSFIWLLIVAFIIGGVTNPLYSLYIAYTNDYLEHDDMASASGGLIFLTGIGAIFGPSIVGWLLDAYGAASYFWFIGSVMAIMGSYALYRMTQTSSTAVEDTNAYAPITPTSTPIAMELAQEYAIEMALEEEEINQ